MCGTQIGQVLFSLLRASVTSLWFCQFTHACFNTMSGVLGEDYCCALMIRPGDVAGSENGGYYRTNWSESVADT